MEFDDKVKNKSDQASGKVKETLGKLTDNEELEAEGRLKHDKAKLAEAAEKVKKSVQDAADDVRDVLKR